MTYDFIILGSGLTAYAALLELTKTDSKILIIDYGLNHKISSKELKHIDLMNIKVDDVKNFIGDDFATKIISKDFVDGLNYSNSYAYGGLSNIWGCSIERFDHDEFSDWLDIAEGLNEGYDLLDKSIPIMVPLDSDGKICTYYFNKLKNQNFSNVQVRKSKLTIFDSSCIRCGECLFGCRHDATFSSKNYIQSLEKEKKIDYLNNLYVHSVKDYSESSSVDCVDSNGNKLTFYAKKLLVCTGAINTAKIMLRSFESVKFVEVKDSQYFILPLLGFKSSNKTSSIALSQFVLKQKDIIKGKNIHYQFYAPSTYTHRIIDQKFSFLGLTLPNFIKNRIFILQGYLPSGLSSAVTLTRLGSEIVATESRKWSSLYLNYCVNRLQKVLFKSNLFAVRRLLNVNKTFSGYHFGASFPMSDNFDHENNTDKLGRIKNVKNIHILDSSVLPSIPSGSFTYTVMANEIRIVKELRCL